MRLIPRDNSFYEMFSKMSENLTHGAQVLVALFAEYHTAEEKVKEIRRIENVGDEMMHNILKKLNQTFAKLRNWGRLFRRSKKMARC